MGALGRKLNSSRGATLILALALMLVCIMAGSSILMAAAANVNTVAGREAEQQAYLAVRSAAELLRETSGDTAFQAMMTTTICTWGEPDVTVADYSAEPGDVFGEYLYNAAELVYNGAADPQTAVYTVTPDDGGCAVSITLTMETDYSVTAELAAEGGAYYMMTVRLVPAVKSATMYSDGGPDEHTDTGTGETLSYAVTVRTDTVSVSWTASSVEKGGA